MASVVPDVNLILIRRFNFNSSSSFGHETRGHTGFVHLVGIKVEFTPEQAMKAQRGIEV